MNLSYMTNLHEVLLAHTTKSGISVEFAKVTVWALGVPPTLTQDGERQFVDQKFEVEFWKGLGQYLTNAVTQRVKWTYYDDLGAQGLGLTSCCGLKGTGLVNGRNVELYLHDQAHYQIEGTLDRLMRNVRVSNDNSVDITLTGESKLKQYTALGATVRRLAKKSKCKAYLEERADELSPLAYFELSKITGLPYAKAWAWISLYYDAYTVEVYKLDGGDEPVESYSSTGLVAYNLEKIASMAIETAIGMIDETAGPDTLYDKAAYIGNNKTLLRKRFRETVAVLYKKYAKHFALKYQPQIDMATKTYVGAHGYELRWTNDGQTSIGDVQLYHTKAVEVAPPADSVTLTFPKN